MTGSLSIVNGRVFDGVNATLVDAAVHVQDGQIVAVGGPSRHADHTVDARGGTVLPGLIDAHFHAYGVHEDILTVESTQLSYLALAAARRLTRALGRGFTTVRDPSGGDAGLDRAIAEGLFPSPRYLWTGAALSQTGGHGDGRRPGQDLGTQGPAVMCEVVDGPDALRAAVRERVRTGAHAIKIMASGGVTSTSHSLPEYTSEEVRAVTDEARRHGRYVTAHAYSSAAIQHAVRNGVTCIEHGNLLDEETAQLMTEAGVSFVPTLAVYDAMARRGAEVGVPPSAFQRCAEFVGLGQQAIRLARHAGVRIGFGTDLLGALEDDQLQGLRLQVDAVGVLDTLRAATSDNAAILGRDDIGRVAEGAAADLLVLDGDVLADPGLLWRDGSRLVIANGRIQ